MDINDLSAADLAKFDAICLQYETDLRLGRAPSIDAVVKHFGGDRSELLRAELIAIEQEVLDRDPPSIASLPFQIPALAQPESKQSIGKNTRSPAMASVAGDPQDQDAPANESLTIAQPPLQKPSPQKDPTPPRSSDEIKLPSPGDRIGPYVVGGRIGQGGMGAVFRAVDTRLDREVAIKVLSLGGNQRQELNDRFEREAKAVAALSHPSIVELFDVGVVNEQPYTVMELLQGETLADRLENGRLSASEVRFVGAQIADALATAHTSGVIHRDLKPQNIMILGKRTTRGHGDGDSGSETQDAVPTLSPSRFEIATNRLSSDSGASSGRVKVFDFGLSLISSEFIRDDGVETKAGAIMGTPGYMSPEQVRGETATTAADVFALGCVLYRSFYGQDPIRGATAAERFASTLATPEPPDESIVAEDRDLAALIIQCLAQRPADRPESASKIASLLRQPIQVPDPVMSQLNAGYQSGENARRRFLASLGGGLVGAMAGYFSMPDPISELRQVRSLAVLSLDPDALAPGDQGAPIGTRKLSPGEDFSALLVNELSQLKDLAVPPYRAFSASSAEDFQRLGSKLNVDAFVTGSVVAGRAGTQEYLDVDLQIVSATTGQQLWGHKAREEYGDNLLQQSLLATEIADQIGLRLTATLQKSPSRPRKSYTCLVDGKVRAEPDSKTGMQMALKCLENARKVDPTYVQPVAGIALVSIVLAAQSDASTTQKLVKEAIDATDKALQLDKQSVDARLAAAMIQWQTLFEFKEAQSDLKSLAMLNPRHWQVQHQYGLLLMAMRQESEAARVLAVASRLNSLSMLIKADVARASWFFGNPGRAVSEAKFLRDDYPDQRAAQGFSRGLLIDIYEHQKQYEEAAAQDPAFERPDNFKQETYFAARSNRLRDLPYGPFGEKMNDAILASRMTNQASETDLSRLAKSASPMFPLLLAVHPALAELRELDGAKTLMVEPIS